MTTTTLLTLQSWRQRMERALGDQVTESRLLGALLAINLITGMVTSALWIFSGDTMISRVAGLSAYPRVIAYGWMALGALVLPYFAMQAFGLWMQWRRKITRLACRSLLASGVLWAFFAYLSKNIDTPFATGIFIACSLVSTGMSALLASSINTAQAREAQSESTACENS